MKVIGPAVTQWDLGLSPELCKKIIERFEADKRVQPDPQPDYSTRKYLNVSECGDWSALNVQVAKRANEITREYFKRPRFLRAATHEEWADDGFVVSRYDVGDACIMHVDGQCPVAPQNGLRLATLLFYLNDVEDGGETWFPLQDLKVKPARGRAVMFPVGFSHPHEVLKATSARYILQTWITDPHMVVTARPPRGRRSGAGPAAAARPRPHPTKRP